MKNLKKQIKSGFSLLVVGLLMSGAATQAEFVDPAWEKYTSSQKKLQVAIHHLVRLHKPRLKPYLDDSLSLKLAQVKRKSEQFYFLSKNHPERMDRSNGFHKFVHFEWTPEDELALMGSQKSYRKLVKRIEKLELGVQEHPDRDVVTELLETIKTERKYTEIQARFRFVSEEIEEMLQNTEAGVSHAAIF